MKIRPGQIRPADLGRVYVLTSDAGVVAWSESAPGGGGGGFRSTVTWQVATPPNSVSSGALPLIFGIRILKIEVTAPCRIRFYATKEARDADRARAIDVRAEGNHGLMAEFIFSGEENVLIASPAIDLANLESAPQPEIPYNVTNLSAAPEPVQITMVYHENETALRAV